MGKRKKTINQTSPRQTAFFRRGCRTPRDAALTWPPTPDAPLKMEEIRVFCVTHPRTDSFSTVFSTGVEILVSTPKPMGGPRSRAHAEARDCNTCRLFSAVFVDTSRERRLVLKFPPRDICATGLQDRRSRNEVGRSVVAAA